MPLAQSYDEAKRQVERLVERFDRNLDAYKRPEYKEAHVRAEFIDPLFETLGWDVRNTKGYAEQYKDVVHEDSLTVSGAVRAPDYCFRIGGTRKFFLEAKKPSVSVKGDVGPAYQLRRYAWSAKLPLSILTDFEEFAVYDCQRRPVQNDKAGVARILYFTYDQYPDCFEEVYSIFARQSILEGSFDRYVQDTKGKRGTSEVDAEFLREIEGWRETLARNLALRNPGLSVHELNYAVQRTIDRIIFLRMAEDRGIEPYERLKALTSGPQIYARLAETLYRQADEKYNSGLFDFQADTLTPSLLIDDRVLKPILNGLYYPECPYEFSVLPAEVLGQVYEQFLGKVIRLTPSHRAVVEEKPEVKKAGGVYYTPSYIVDYIVQQTVGVLVEGKSPRQLRGVGDKPPVRVLDPACGSGSFLLGAYQYLLDHCLRWYEENDPEKHAHRNEPPVYQGAGGDWRLTTAEKKRILLDHIYGVDIDRQAVEVTKLSLLLKVLEGETQETLGQQLSLWRERALPDLAHNIKCGNSLIGPDYFEGKLIVDEEEARRVNAFDWEREFPEVFATGPSPPAPLPGGEGSMGSLPPARRPEREGSMGSLPPARRPEGEGSMGSLPPALLERARALRREATDAERLLWSLLRNRRFLGLKFRRQHPLGGYILDFYCHEARLGIELDGGQHAEPEQAARDAQRTRDLEELGVRVVRFWNHEVLKETEAVLEAIMGAVEDDPHRKPYPHAKPHPHPDAPLPEGEGMGERGLEAGLPSPGGEGGFDAVIGNPPYGFHEIHLESIKPYLRDHFVASHGSFEHYFLFYEGSLRLLRQDGLHGFIVPVTWLTIPSARSLRTFILANYWIREICWLPEFVFRNAKVNTLVSIVQNSRYGDVTVQIHNTLGFRVPPQETRSYPQSQFIDSDYYIGIFETESDSAIIDRISAVSQPLGEIARPCSGYNPYERGKGTAPHGGPHTRETVKRKPYHSEGWRGDEWKPEIVGRDLGRYSVTITGKRWIKYGPWLAAPRDPDNFLGKRILVQEIVGGKDRRIVAAYYDGELYHSRDVIPVKIENALPHAFYLLGAINSQLITWYHHRRNPKAQKGLFPKILVSDLRSLPIRTIDFDDPADVARHDRMVALVERMLELHKKLAGATIPAEKVLYQRQIGATDRQIDALVYELYGLTEEEIAIVEG